MKPTHFVQSNEPPTITNLVAQGLSAGLDRFVGVQPKLDDQPAGVAVFLMSGNAIREVGPFLRDHLTKLKQNPQQPGEFLEATEATTLPQIFAALKTLGHQWVYMDLPFGGLLTIVIGDSVNEAFAAELTKRGAICNLR